MYQCLKDTGREGDWQSFAAFPIVTRQGRQNPVHEPVPYEMFKDLKKSIKDNELQSPYTVGLLTAMTEAFRMAPCDWVALARTTLTPSQFTVWHSEYMIRCRHQANENGRTGNPVTHDMLLGLGQYTRPDQQAHMDPQTFFPSALPRLFEPSRLYLKLNYAALGPLLMLDKGPAKPI